MTRNRGSGILRVCAEYLTPDPCLHVSENSSQNAMYFERYLKYLSTKISTTRDTSSTGPVKDGKITFTWYLQVYYFSTVKEITRNRGSGILRV